MGAGGNRVSIELDELGELEVTEPAVLEELVELDCSMESERNGKLGSGNTGASLELAT